MTILMCAQKLTDANLIYRTVPKTKTSKMKKTKTQTDMLRKKRCRARNHGVSPEGGRKSRVEMICGTGRFCVFVLVGTLGMLHLRHLRCECSCLCVYVALCLLGTQLFRRTTLCPCHHQSLLTACLRAVLCHRCVTD